MGAAGVEGMTFRSREVRFLGTKVVNGSEPVVVELATYRSYYQTSISRPDRSPRCMACAEAEMELRRRAGQRQPPLSEG